MTLSQHSGLMQYRGLSGFAGVATSGLMGAPLQGILFPLNGLVTGQSLGQYVFIRGTPRVSLDFMTSLRTSLGGTESRAFSVFAAATPIIVSDGTTRTSTDYSMRLINAARGGSAWIDASSATEVDPATSSTSGEPNYWWNTVNNTAITGNALDVANSPALRWRDAIQWISDYGIDYIVHSQGETDQAYVGLGSTERATFKNKLKDFITECRVAAGNTSMPFFFSHFGRGNQGTNAGYQTIADIHNEIVSEMDNVFIGTEQYFASYGIAATIANCTTSTLNETVLVANTSGIAVNQNIQGPGIQDNSYVVSLVTNVSFTLTTGKIPTASAVVTLNRMDSTHPYPGPDGTQPLDTDSNTRHDGNLGFYNIWKRLVRPIKMHYINATGLRAFGPKVSAVSAAIGTDKVYLSITHDEGTTLTTLNGAISVLSSAFIRVENNDVAMTISDIVLASSTAITITTSSNISAGTIKVWIAYQAMNRTDYRDIIIDNATVPMPLQRSSPTVNSVLSIVPGDSVPVNTVQPLIYGSANVGETLYVTTGTWVGSVSFTYTYQWKKNGVNTGTNVASLSMSGLSVNDVILCVVTATNSQGSTSADATNPQTLAARNASLFTINNACVFDLDATLATSANGVDKVWRSVVPSPADGALITDYTFNAGANSTASTDDPTLTGTVGDAATYFELDGGDYWTLEDLANSNFFRDLHKTTGASPCTFVFTCRTPATMATLQVLFGTASSITTDHGLYMGFSSTDKLSLSQLVADAASHTTNSTASLSASTIYALGVGFDFSSGTSGSMWINSATAEAKTVSTATSTTDASFAARLGARGASSSKPLSGTRVYSMAMFNKVLSNAEWDAIITQLETRHARTYF